MNIWFQPKRTTPPPVQDSADFHPDDIPIPVPSLSSEVRPHDDPKADSDQLDTYIAEALGRLTTKERDLVYHELHGVDDVIEEEPQFVALKLEEMKADLFILKDRHARASAYRLAETMSPAYVSDRTLLLKFLRAESFRPRLAAERMMRFFDIKMFLFGQEKLCKDITLEDLSSDDLHTLKAGFLQLLPVRDRAGRAIIIFMPVFQTYKTPENMTRVLFYLYMSGVDDEETQKRGFVTIIYGVGGSIAEKTNLKTITQGTWVQSACPFKMCSLHHCFDVDKDERAHFLVNLSMQFLPEEAKARAKVHSGGHVECVYALMTFGIPVDNVPMTMDGELKKKSHSDWIKMRKLQEAAPPTETRILVPSRKDVLFGRGKPFREHIGNLRLFNLLDTNLGRYESLRMKEKSNLIGEMVEIIKVEGGRFLKQEAGIWVPVDDKMAHEKVSHAFRTRLRIASTSSPSSDTMRSDEATPVRISSSALEGKPGNKRLRL